MNQIFKGKFSKTIIRMQGIKINFSDGLMNLNVHKFFRKKHKSPFFPNKFDQRTF